MEYLYAGNWVYGMDTTSEAQAVQRSRQLWKAPGVAGVRVLRTETAVIKQAER